MIFKLNRIPVELTWLQMMPFKSLVYFKKKQKHDIDVYNFNDRNVK